MAMIPLEVKEKLFRLKNENKKLKEQVIGSNLFNKNYNVYAKLKAELSFVYQIRAKKVWISSNQNLLQINIESSGGQNEVLQTLVDDLTEREARLESSNRKLNQKILELESKLEEARWN